MLELKNIVKTYEVGDLKQTALKGVSISFRENEFVSILGQSGSGKTTMLNIIGGLDRYTSGDLVINGVSTTKYKDSDWDYYRNNSIGFVFQSYNLIPHQTVLANVEMALTLAGVSKKERRERAIAVLKKVGLADHIHKRPNQMSGGQMQRVAIARALVNNPDILLADEPTGALDSETSVQIMELLKEIAKDKLVIMVTHNPELAEQYSTRIVRLLDGEIVYDTNPYKPENVEKASGKHNKISMSFGTALSLSFNNLRTKKGRTILTAFAGSIGIIGIALILSLSTGMNTYITDVQKETMSSYPITISSQTIDISGVMGMRAEVIGERRENNLPIERSGVWADFSELEMSERMTSSIVENDLTGFKKYLDDPESEIRQYLGENGVIYSYDVNFSVYSHDADGKLVDSDSDPDGKSTNQRATLMSQMSGTNSSAANFSELMPEADGKGISAAIKDSYELLYGSYPESADEVVLVLDRNNSLSAKTLYQLGLITKTQYNDVAEKIKNGESADEISFSYSDACGHELYLVPACEKYKKNADGSFELIADATLDEAELLENSIKLKISGIIRPTEDQASIMTAIGYTSELTERIIDQTNESEIIKAQEADKNTNVLTGMAFESTDDSNKAADAKEYLGNLGVSEKAAFYKMMASYAGTAAGGQTAMSGNAAAGGQTTAGENAAAGAGANRNTATGGMADETTMAAALDAWLAGEPSEEILVMVYDEYIAGATYEDNMKAFGKVSYDAPSSISIYTDSFEAKDQIAECIKSYNDGVGEDEKITYTDYVAMLTSSITTIIDGISYVLIAFVAISLVVSCIMIGIITHISVMERTKEIGILRALGASKLNISQVFNAETFIIGCFSGIIGIGVSLAALIPINAVITKLSGLSDLKAQLPLTSSLILIAISIIITIIGGLIPAKKAANKDPVIALRTE